MGRELKRITLDFDWPLKQIWKGYINPYQGHECKTCDGTGLSPDYKQLDDDWYGFNRPQNKWNHSITQDEVQALIDNGRLFDFTKANEYIPSAKEVNEWSKHGLGHDSINKSICVEARAKRLGITEQYCKYCEGEGITFPEEKYFDLQNEFKYIEPPIGAGYQIWETVSEGSPISPVFKTQEELAIYMSLSAKGIDAGTSYEQWMKFIEGPGWSLGEVISNGKIQTGVNAIK